VTEHQAAEASIPAPVGPGNGLTGEDRELMRGVARYVDHANRLADRLRADEASAVGAALSRHLGAPVGSLPIVVHAFAAHRLVDADLALEELSGSGDGELLGISGGEQKLHHGLAELVSREYGSFSVGPVDFRSLATGPDSTRQVVSYGLRLLHHRGHPLALLQRAASAEHGRPQASVEVVSASPAAVDDFLTDLRDLMVRRSVLRGQVLTFTPSEYGPAAGATFAHRPSVPARDVVLADGVLEKMTRHVVGIGAQRERLLAAGQHLKRGILLYGPPGTGKTLSVRHLLSITPQSTAILLTGSSIALVTEAAELARLLQPSIVVLEDIDLVAMERGYSPQPLLFEVLDALDGLDGDADVAFIMTTNRVQVLERALAERPGRVDLAVEVPLPSLAERRRLLHLYAGDLPFSGQALEDAARDSEGSTGSFAKELVRRTVLAAALEGEAPPTDRHLMAELAEMQSSREALTRRLLGGEQGADEGTEPWDGDGFTDEVFAGEVLPDEG
jgi:hypothetical protein